MGIMLSILIPTTPDREELVKSLFSSLIEQYNFHTGFVDEKNKKINGCFGRV